MTIVDFNEEQLKIGEEVVKDINNNINSYEESLDNDLDKVKSAGKAYKVNLENTIVISGLAEGLETMRDDLVNMNALAAKQYDLLEQYQNGELATEAFKAHMSPEAYLNKMAFGMSNAVNPDVGTKVAATAAMGIFKFGEGFLEFFEDIGDAAITVGAGVTSLLGFKSASKSMKQFAKKTLATNFVENNKAFEWIHRNSYFDKDSTYSHFFKFGGKITGAIVTGKVASSLYTAHAANASSKVLKAKDIATNAKKISTRTTKVTNLLSAQGSNVTSSLRSGRSLKFSLADGTVTSALTWGLSKGVTTPISNAAGEKIAETQVGTMINKADQKATDIFGQEVKDTVGEVSKTAVDTTVRTGKKETTGHLVGNEGNEKSTEDQAAEYAANTSIDVAKNSAEKTIEKSIIKSVL